MTPKRFEGPQVGKDFDYPPLGSEVSTCIAWLFGRRENGPEEQSEDSSSAMRDGLLLAITQAQPAPLQHCNRYYSYRARMAHKASLRPSPFAPRRAPTAL